MSNLPTPNWLQAGSYSANMDRYLIEAIWPAAAGGILAGMSAGPRGAGANMSVDVAVGSCVVHGGDVANQASYLCRLLGVTNMPVGAAPGAGLTRIDLVVAQVVDPAALGSGTAGWVLAVVAGTPAASPSPPAVPPSATVLAQISVPNGTASIQAANLTDRRAFLPQLTVPAAPAVALLGAVDTSSNSSAAVEIHSNFRVTATAGPLGVAEVDIVLSGLYCTVTASDAIIYSQMDAPPWNIAGAFSFLAVNTPSTVIGRWRYTGLVPGSSHSFYVGWAQVGGGTLTLLGASRGGGAYSSHRVTMR